MIVKVNELKTVFKGKTPCKKVEKNRKVKYCTYWILVLLQIAIFLS